MTGDCIEKDGVWIVQLFEQGPLLSKGGDAIEWIRFASDCNAKVLVIPRARFPEAFFELRSGLAGELMQKFTTYRMHVAIIGDFSREIAESRSFASLVLESNRGDTYWFLRDGSELSSRLQNMGTTLRQSSLR